MVQGHGLANIPGLEDGPEVICFLHGRQPMLRQDHKGGGERTEWETEGGDETGAGEEIHTGTREETTDSKRGQTNPIGSRQKGNPGSKKAGQSRDQAEQ